MKIVSPQPVRPSEKPLLDPNNLERKATDPVMERTCEISKPVFQSLENMVGQESPSRGSVGRRPFSVCTRPSSASSVIFDESSRKFILNPEFRGTPLAYGRITRLQQDEERSQNSTPIPPCIPPSRLVRSRSSELLN